MSDVLLKLQDGDILGFSEEHSSESGCETCDYGSSYVQDFTVETTNGSVRFDVDNMYDYAITHDFLLKAMLPNVATIQAMTIAEFIEWLTEKFKSQAKVRVTNNIK